MFVYRLSDLYSKLDELKEAGFEYVTMHEFDPDDDFEFPSVNFEGITMENSSVDFEEVEAVALPDGYYFEY